MRTAAIQRATGRGEQPVEIARRRELHSFRPALDLQAAPIECAECSRRALLYLRRIVVVAVAIRRGVDENQKALFAVDLRAVVVAVLGADIDRRFARHPAVPENVVKFGGVVARKEHVVTEERKALRSRRQAPGHRRQRARAGRYRRSAAFGRGAEQPTGNRADVGIDDYRISSDAFAALEPDAAGTPGGNQDFADLLAVSNSRAKRFRGIGQDRRKAMHAALNAPYAFTLDMGNQHQGGGRQKGR